MKKNIFLIALFFFISYSDVFSIDYFYDNFTSKDTGKWDFYLNGGSIEIIDDNLSLSSNDYRFPYIFNKDSNLFPTENDFIFDARFKYDSYGPMGDGISLGFKNINGVFFEQFQLWRDAESGAFLKYNDLNTGDYNFCSEIGLTNVSTGTITTNLTLNDGWHILRIKRIGTIYNVYLDPDINNQPIFISSENQCIPKSILLGGIYTGGSAVWNNLSIDYIRIYNGDTPTPTSTPIPTSTPTPIPAPKVKIIILPGLGASWNSEAIVSGIVIGNDQWKMTPFVKNYNSLINALKQNGLVEKEDFYVWNYDWRKPLVEIINDLNGFINQNVDQNEKVILVGHSLGGLTARIWAENNKNDSRLGKVITLGSPHLGSVETYEIWNGGQISDLSKISSIAFKVLLKIQGLTTKTDMEAVRKYTPLVKDLLPTFNFVKKNGINLTNDKLETKNTFLENKNNESVGSTMFLKLFSGNGFKTEDSVELKDNNIFDKVLGIWPDGRINKFLYSTSGDGTVLVKSANYAKSDFVNVESNHSEIVDKTVNKVMLEIGLSQVDVVSETQDLNDSLVVFVGSSMNYSVKCDNESPVDGIDGFVVIKNKNYKSCIINLVGTGNGIAHIVAGNTSDNDWSYWEKKVVNSESNKIKINPSDGQIINDKNNISFLKSIIKTDINSLLSSNKNNKYLKEALKNLEKNQPKSLMINIFSFRDKKDERLISEKIIDNSTIWLSLINKCSKNEAVMGVRMVDNYQNLIKNLIYFKNKKNLKINEEAAISYQKMDLLIENNKEKIGQKDYSNVCANNFAALNYGNEVLIKAYNKNDFKMWLLRDF